MPSLRKRSQQPTPVSPQVPVPADFPDIPQEVLDRFPEAADWQRRLDEFWTTTKQALQQAQQQVANAANSKVVYSVDSFLIYAKGGIPEPMFALSALGVKLADVLTISTAGRKVFIGEGNYQDANTPFYVDADGKFSLGANLTWNPETSTLTITGTINATSGTIGGFTIGTDYIRDVGNSMGLASTVTGGDDVRFWAGSTFAARATAPFRVTEAGVLVATSATISGSITATSGSVGGWTIGATTLTGGSATLSSTGVLTLGTSNDVVVLSAADATYRLWIGNATAASAPFRVTKTGILTATGAVITGSITATTGSIGGFDVGADYIRDAANSMGLASTVTGGDDVRFWAGATFASRASAPFRVTESGALVASNANISGTLTSSSGTIGGFTIGASTLSSGSGTSQVILNTDGSLGNGLQLGTSAGTWSIHDSTGFYVLSGGTTMAKMLVSGGAGFLEIYDTGGSPAIILNGTSRQINCYRLAIGTYAGTPSLSDGDSFFAGNTYFNSTVTNPGSGNTSVGVSVEYLAGNGAALYVSRGDNACAVFNRNGDGSLVLFARSGTQVGSISITTTNTAYNTSSDRRIKTSITNAPDVGAIIDAIRVREFEFIKERGRKVIGFVAQELHEAYRDAVTPGDNRAEIWQLWNMDRSALVPLLMREVQSLRARVLDLEGA